METNQAPDHVVIALAARRIDAPDTDPPRFPLENMALVRQRLADMFATERAEALVCSAACGADLIALEEAERLGIRRRIVLPFSPDRFRDTSVIDCPGNWGPIFDRIIASATSAGDLIVLDDLEGNNDAAYAAANVRSMPGCRNTRPATRTVWPYMESISRAVGPAASAAPYDSVAPSRSPSHTGQASPIVASPQGPGLAVAA